MNAASLVATDHKECSSVVKCPATAVRGMLRYVVSTGKYPTESPRCTLAEAEHVSEPCHCDLATDSNDAATVTL